MVCYYGVVFCKHLWLWKQPSPPKLLLIGEIIKSKVWSHSMCKCMSSHKSGWCPTLERYTILKMFNGLKVWHFKSVDTPHCSQMLISNNCDFFINYIIIICTSFNDYTDCLLKMPLSNPVYCAGLRFPHPLLPWQYQALYLEKYVHEDAEIFYMFTLR